MPRLAGDHGQRDLASGRSLRRYRCGTLGCDWQGLLVPSSAPRVRRAASGQSVPGRSATGWLRRLSFGDVATRAESPGVPNTVDATRQPGAARRPSWSRLGGVALASSLFVLVGVQSLRWMMGPSIAPAESPRVADATVPAVPAGESHDGDALPERHPWLQPVVFDPAAAASGAAAAQAVEPLAMRRNCAWGQPGRNPYRGSVEQALVHARLPPEVVAEISAKVQRHDIADRLEIRTGRIQGVQRGREFDPNRLAMSFGNTLCLNSRVNFAPGHTEAADLYEATDHRGRRHAVMVPDVCGNVTVLGERGERKRRTAGGAGGDPGVRLVGGDDPGSDEWQVLASGALPDRLVVPVPGTLVLLGGGLMAWGALAVARRRRIGSTPGA